METLIPKPRRTASFVDDPELKAKKARELARLMNRQLETQGAKPTVDAFSASLFEDVPATNDKGQTLLF